MKGQVPPPTEYTALALLLTTMFIFPIPKLLAQMMILLLSTGTQVLLLHFATHQFTGDKAEHEGELKKTDQTMNH